MLLIDASWAITPGSVLPPHASGDTPGQFLHVSKVRQKSGTKLLIHTVIRRSWKCERCARCKSLCKWSVCLQSRPPISRVPVLSHSAPRCQKPHPLPGRKRHPRHGRDTVLHLTSLESPESERRANLGRLSFITSPTIPPRCRPRPTAHFPASTNTTAPSRPTQPTAHRSPSETPQTERIATMAALAPKQESLKIFEKLKAKSGNKVRSGDAGSATACLKLSR